MPPSGRLFDHMTSKSEATYIDVRERILFGELPAGSAFSAPELMALTGVNQTMAGRLLLSLKTGGYITRSGNSYVISSFTTQQVEEWGLALGSIVEIGALRIALGGEARLKPLVTFLETHLRDIPIDHEDFFLGAMGLTRIVLGGEHSCLSQLVQQFIPQVFFRLLWMSDYYAPRTGFLVESADRFVSAARAGDLNAVRAASRHFFDNIAPSLHTLVAKMGEGTYPPKVKKDGFLTIEAQITGMPTYANAIRAASLALTPLPDANLTALRV